MIPEWEMDALHPRTVNDIKFEQYLLREYGMTKKEEIEKTFWGNVDALSRILTPVDIFTLGAAAVAKLTGKKVWKEVGEEGGEKTVKTVAGETSEILEKELVEGITDDVAKIVTKVEGGSDVVKEDINAIKNNLINKVKNIREQMPNINLKKRGNMVVADVDVSGMKDNFVAHSKINVELDKEADVAEFYYLKPEDERIFTTYINDKFPRYHDTKAKILEDIASQITEPNVNGIINLYSELLCRQSCSNIILEFRRMFPNIKLNIFVE